MLRRVLTVSLTAAVLFALAPSVRGASLYVANNGIDPIGCMPSTCVLGLPCRCGTKTSPCRSISCAIMNAAAGDTIIVGPGRYGDLNENGTLAERGEETPSSGCGCVLSINKPVVVVSSDGAAATVIDSRTVDVIQNVLVIASAEFGRPGEGFTVTFTKHTPAGNAIVVDASAVKIRGNQAIGPFLSEGIGIRTVKAPESILIDQNQAMGWAIGILAEGGNKTVSKNHVSLNADGIGVSGEPSTVTGNVVAANEVGISASGGAVAVIANAVYGSGETGLSVDGLTGSVEKNDLLGNDLLTTFNCGLNNAGAAAVVATNNYWGAPTGPGADPADDACNFGGGATTATPFATKPFKVKPPLKP